MNIIRQINTINEVREFAIKIINEGVILHPDNNFLNYVDIETEEPTYSTAEASLRNNLMRQCFKVCKEKNIDIYDFMLEIYLSKTGLDKYIPVPSAEYSG